MKFYRFTYFSAFDHSVTVYTWPAFICQAKSSHCSKPVVLFVREDRSVGLILSNYQPRNLGNFSSHPLPLSRALKAELLETRFARGLAMYFDQSHKHWDPNDPTT
jgi:hypothetical protein